MPYDRTEPSAEGDAAGGGWSGDGSSASIITVVILVALYLWQRAAFGPGLWVVYGVLFGISLAWLAVYVAGYVQAKQELASIGQGVAAADRPGRRAGRRRVRLLAAGAAASAS